MKYSQERKPSAEFRPKQAVLAKLAPPYQRTVKDVAAEEGISPTTLYYWRQQARLNVTVHFKPSIKSVLSPDRRPNSARRSGTGLAPTTCI